jgi:hypothetical protein
MATSVSHAGTAGVRGICNLYSYCITTCLLLVVLVLAPGIQYSFLIAYIGVFPIVTYISGRRVVQATIDRTQSSMIELVDRADITIGSSTRYSTSINIKHSIETTKITTVAGQIRNRRKTHYCIGIAQGQDRVP